MRDCRIYVRKIDQLPHTLIESEVDLKKLPSDFFYRLLNISPLFNSNALIRLSELMAHLHRFLHRVACHLQ